MPEEKRRLSAADWTTAALDALAEGGIAAVAVEPLASRLGTTKGSFYWHFGGREALLAAALEQWERVDTEDVITLVEAETDPHSRLDLLIRTAIDSVGPGRTRAVELALLSTADHPLVAPALARVTRRRLDYLAALFTELGFVAAEATRRALLAYTAYLGHAQLTRATPELAPSGAALPGYLEVVVATLTDRPTGTKHSQR